DRAARRRGAGAHHPRARTGHRRPAGPGGLPGVAPVADHDDRPVGDPLGRRRRGRARHRRVAASDDGGRERRAHPAAPMGRRGPPAAHRGGAAPGHHARPARRVDVRRHRRRRRRGRRGPQRAAHVAVHVVNVERCPKRVRAYIAGELVADTINALYVWEGPAYPAYYIPAEDVRATLVPTGATEHWPSRGDAEVLDVKTSRGVVGGAARRYPSPRVEALAGHVRFEWEAMDEWLEEDEPVYVHPRDPYTRVDILDSSRHVEVRVDGET